MVKYGSTLWIISIKIKVSWRHGVIGLWMRSSLKIYLKDFWGQQLRFRFDLNNLIFTKPTWFYVIVINWSLPQFFLIMKSCVMVWMFRSFILFQIWRLLIWIPLINSFVQTINRFWFMFKAMSAKDTVTCFVYCYFKSDILSFIKFKSLQLIRAWNLFLSIVIVYLNCFIYLLQIYFICIYITGM